MQRGASLSAVNCDGDVPLDIALDETTESLLQDYTLKQGDLFSICVYSRHYTFLKLNRNRMFFSDILILLAVLILDWPRTASCLHVHCTSTNVQKAW